MLSEVYSYESYHEWQIDAGVRYTLMTIQMQHHDRTLSKLICRAIEPPAFSNNKRTPQKQPAYRVEWELWRCSPPPASDAHEMKMAHATYGGRMVRYCIEKLGTRVGNGECWTLAERAVTKAGASPPVGYNWGDELCPEQAMPGDVMQFTSCRFEWPLTSGGHSWRTAGAATETEGCIHHTAVIAEVGTDNNFTVFEQNTSPATVHRQKYCLNHLVSGEIKIFRPRRAAGVIRWPRVEPRDGFLPS